MHPVVWAHAANPKRRRAEQAVRKLRLVTLDLLPCGRLLGFRCLLLVFVRMTSLLGLSPLASWIKFAQFLGSVHRPREVGDLWVGGVSYLERLILYERWAGRRLVLEIAVPFEAGGASNFIVGCSVWSRH